MQGSLASPGLGPALPGARKEVGRKAQAPSSRLSIAGNERGDI